MRLSVAAPSSTKNKKKERDPDAHQTKKGNQWYFGYKGHIGVDRDTGLVNKIRTTAANVHDSTPVPDLIEGTEEEIYGDSGYLGIDQHDNVPKVNREGKKIAFEINVRRSSLKKLPEAEQEKAQEAEHAKSSVRSKVEHVFAVVKGILRYRKTRLRGLLAQGNQFIHGVFQLFHRSPGQYDDLILGHVLGRGQTHAAAAACDDADCFAHGIFLLRQSCPFPSARQFHHGWYPDRSAWE